MGKRRQSRELAIQFLYQIDMAGQEDWQKAIESFWNEQDITPDVKEFSNRIINKVIEEKKEIDKLITSYTTNWDIDRIAVVDRNILRTAISELLYMDDIPPIVSINEAVDIAKKFGSSESGKFVNGILDKIRLEHAAKKGSG